MNALEQARRAANMTQQHMADALGVATSTYCQYETGARKIPAVYAEGIAKLLHCEIADIFLPEKFTVSKI